MDQTVIETGISFGAALAICISFTTNRSVFWAIIAGLLGWLYVIYAVITANYHKE